MSGIDKVAIKPLREHWQKAMPREKSMLSALAPIMLSTGAAGMMMIDKTFKTKVAEITRIEQ